MKILNKERMVKELDEFFLLKNPLRLLIEFVYMMMVVGFMKALLLIDKSEWVMSSKLILALIFFFGTYVVFIKLVWRAEGYFMIAWILGCMALVLPGALWLSGLASYFIISCMMVNLLAPLVYELKHGKRKKKRGV